MGTSNMKIFWDAFSGDRLAPYLAASGYDPEIALRLYAWNVEISAAFHGLLHCLEVVLRTAMHDRLVAHFGRADWWDEPAVQLHGPVRRQLAADLLSILEIIEWTCPDVASWVTDHDRVLYVLAPRVDVCAGIRHGARRAMLLAPRGRKGRSIPEPTLHGRVAALERHADESETVVETLTDEVNKVRLGNARILKHLGALMNARGVAAVGLTEGKTDDLSD